MEPGKWYYHKRESKVVRATGEPPQRKGGFSYRSYTAPDAKIRNFFLSDHFMGKKRKRLKAVFFGTGNMAIELEKYRVISFRKAFLLTFIIKFKSWKIHKWIGNPSIVGYVVFFTLIIAMITLFKGNQ